MGDVHRGRQVIDYAVQQGLDAFVLIGRTADYRVQFAGAGLFADGGFQLVIRDFLAFQVFHHEVVVAFGNGFDQFITIFLGLLFVFVGDIGEFLFLAQGIIIGDGLHADQVDHAFEVVFGTHRDLQGNGIGVQAVLHHVHDTEEVGADDIHLIYISHTGNIVFVSLAPYGFRLGFNAALCGEDGDGAVQHAQGTLYFDREVNVARGVDDVDTMGFILLLGAIPQAGGGSRSDGDTAFLFLNHPVHGGSTVMNFANLMGLAGVEQDTFRRGGLTGIDVCHDADVSRSLKRN